MSELSIVVADDHALLRSGLVQVLNANGYGKVTEANNGEDALQLIKENSPDICILDIEMPGLNGFQIVNKLREEERDPTIIFLTMHKEETIFNKALDHGVKGYVLKENTVREIVSCIEAVKEGKSYVSPVLADSLMRRASGNSKTLKVREKINQLTPTEMEVMEFLSEMKTNQEIADEMHVSIKTVQNHRTNICKKLEISGTHALLKFAVNQKSDFDQSMRG